MTADYQLSLRDYVAIARRWAWAIILTFGTVLAISVVVALVLPRIYEATGTLLAEAPPVPGDGARPSSTVSAEQRIQALERRIMTRESLLRVAHEHKVFDETATSLKDADKVDAMRKSIQMSILIGNGPAWERPTNNFAFNLSYQHSEPEKALEVTRALIDLFLKSSVQERVDLAVRANEFLGQEADRVKAQLEDLERRIASYKLTQGATTGDDGRAAALADIQSLERDLRTAEREHRAALDELQTLEVDLAGARSGVVTQGSVSTPGPSATELELERARAELARLRVYTEDHPDLRIKRQQIEMLERTLRSEANASSPSREVAAAQTRLAASRFEAQIATTRARADLLLKQQSSLRSSIGQLRSQVARAPQVERDLAALQRDHDAARAQYEDLRSKQMSAQFVQNLEGEQQGERFSLLEPPLMPEDPVKPSRKKLVALGLFLALAAAAGVAVLLEAMFARVRGINALTALTGQRPLVVIPYISTTADLQSAQQLRKRVIALAAGLGVATLLIVHTMVTPLHTLLISLFAHLG